MEGFYACGVLRRSIPYSSFRCSKTFPGLISTYGMNGRHFQGGPMRLKFQICTLRVASRACTSSRYFPKENINGALQLMMDDEPSKVTHPQLITGSSAEKDRSDEILEDKIKGYPSHDLGEDLPGTANICDREIQRRRKIGLANKGRTPWNKGRKHSQETRDRIKKRTIEAMRDPKVRKRISGLPRAHSDLSRARIGASLRKIWAERRKHKKSQEKCHLIWARSISEAAREGGLGQEELSWDSYRKLKARIMSQYLQWESEKARAKEIERLRSERMAKVRAEKLARLAQQRQEKEEKARARKTEAMVRKKMKDEKRKMALSQGLKLKARLTKFHPRRKKQPGSPDTVGGEIAIEPQPVIENWGIERIKVEKMQRRVSLADQIRALKKKKSGFGAVSIISPSDSS